MQPIHTNKGPLILLRLAYSTEQVSAYSLAAWWPRCYSSTSCSMMKDLSYLLTVLNLYSVERYNTKERKTLH